MMQELPSIEEMYGTKSRLAVEEPVVADKQNLILRALEVLLRVHVVDLPRDHPRSEEATKILTEIRQAVRRPLGRESA